MSPQLAGGSSFWKRYRWDRILTVGALLIGLVLVIVGLFGPDSEPDQASVETTRGVAGEEAELATRSSAQSEPAVETPDVQTSSGDDVGVGSRGVASTSGPGPMPTQQQGDLLDYAAAAPSNKTTAAPEDTSEAALYDEFPSPPAGSEFSEPEADAAQETGEIIEETSDRLGQPSVIERTPAPSKRAAAPALRTEAVDRGPSDLDQRQRSVGAALSPVATEIVSPDVSRFMITNAIARREPVGTIGDIKEDRTVAGLVRVFAFSSVKNLSGENVVYRWSRGEQVFAEVTVAVGSNSWRSYSSKYLSKDMRGRWRVELLGSSGQLLAYTEFDY